MNRKSLIVVALAVLCVQPLTVDAAALTAKRVKNIANQEITRRAPEFQGVQGLRGVQGPQGFTGAQGLQGLTGAQGAQGPAGSSASSTYASLFADGTLDPAGSSGVSQTNTSHPSTGLYCFGGIPGVVKGAIVTIDFFAAASDEAAQFGFGDLGGSCPAGAQFFVVTHNPGTSFTPVNAGFSVLILK